MNQQDTINILETIQEELQEAESKLPSNLNMEDDISSELGEDVVWLTEKEKQLIEYDV